MMGGLMRAARFVSKSGAAFLLAALIVFSLPGHTQEVPSAEYRIKAAFLYHFCNYIDWPPSAFKSDDSPLLIGIAAPQEIVNQMRQSIEGRTARGRPVVIRAIQPGDSLETLHVIYITEPMNARRFGITALSPRPILVVTEDDDGFAAGSVINFVIEDDRVRFDIAPHAARERNLHVGAQLLTAARNIRGNNGR
ncbi:MAG: YfiR family protein [Proteobacteria bacterium]|nr:YfiR family protein [Pseudomonadota bacterium]